MIVVAGIDVGSGSAKAVLITEDRRVLGRAVERTKADFDGVAREVYGRALAEARIGAGDVAYVASTGLGRYSVSFRDVQITDITCAARGAWALVPEAPFVLDIGSQSTRAIRLGEGGKVREFHTNEKCAAGSGSFLERAAKYLEIPVDALGPRSLASQHPRTISSVCAVLAESEIINHVSEGVPIDDVVRGLHESLAERSLAQLLKVGLNGPVAFVGGVALQSGMIEACRRTFGVPVLVPDAPRFVTAYGAALLGLQRRARIPADDPSGGQSSNRK